MGGGIRSLKRMQELMDLGVSRMMIGTLAVKSPELIAEAVSRFGADAIMPAMDVKDSEIKVSGWEESAELSIDSFVANDGCG